MEAEMYTIKATLSPLVEVMKFLDERKTSATRCFKLFVVGTGGTSIIASAFIATIVCHCHPGVPFQLPVTALAIVGVGLFTAICFFFFFLYKSVKYHNLKQGWRAAIDYFTGLVIKLADKLCDKFDKIFKSPSHTIDSETLEGLIKDYARVSAEDFDHPADLIAFKTALKEYQN